MAPRNVDDPLGASGRRHAAVEDDAVKLAGLAIDAGVIPEGIQRVKAAIGAEKQGLSKLARALMRGCDEGEALVCAKTLSEGDKAHFVACAPDTWAARGIVTHDIVDVLKAKKNAERGGIPERYRAAGIQ
jgi:hypothetical protein